MDDGPSHVQTYFIPCRKVSDLLVIGANLLRQPLPVPNKGSYAML